MIEERTESRVNTTPSMELDELISSSNADVDAAMLAFASSIEILPRKNFIFR